MGRFLIAGTVIVILGMISQGQDRPTIKEMSVAEDQLRKFVPSLSAVEERFPDDLQVLLGLARIYKSYAPSFDYWDRSKQLYRKAVELDPKNKFARAVLAKEIVSEFLGQRGILIDLEMQREYAKDNNLQEVEIPSWSNLYKWLREEGQQRVVIRDFNEARARICDKLNQGLPAVISDLEKAEKIDPENGLYNYVRAAVNFELGKEAEGLTEVERGANKPYLNNYWIEIAAARKRVLQEGGFPEHYREIIENMQTYLGGLPNYDKLMEVAKQQETSQDLKKASRICEVLIRLAEQVRQEPIPGKPGGKRGDNEFSKRIEREAKQQLAKIQIRLQDKGVP
jgi:tetratricopeptide (TPR) repeat protein